METPYNLKRRKKLNKYAAKAKKCRHKKDILSCFACDERHTCHIQSKHKHWLRNEEKIYKVSIH